MSSRDNWERLVAAVLKREQIWQLCHEQSRSPSLSTVSSDFSEQILNFSSNSLEPISVSPPPPIPLTNPYVPQVSNNASGRITRKLFSAWYRRRKHKDEYLVDIPEDIGNHLPQVRRFSLRELKVATDNFSDKNVLQYRYKARLADGSLVGVKRLKHEGSSQSAEVRFQRELEINSIVAHSNVLDVLGFCISPKERLLVYPLMVNGSVASCLWGRPKSQSPLDWPLRKGIALGTARGLAYLHEECSQKIIHRDIKAANILLDEDFEAFIADFELAIIMEHDVIDFEEAVRGTIGHIAPEYLSTGRCSEKTDVFGYGMFLLELITGQRAFDLARLANDEDMMLLDWVKRNFEERKWEMMVDPDCGGMYIDKEVRQLMQVTLLCTQSHPDKRPKMSEVVRMLKDVDGLGERWEERCNEVEMFCEEDLGIHLGRVWRFSLHELQPEKA